MAFTQPDGYLALPATGQGEGVLVLHAWWGLNGTVKGFCKRLAEVGFIAFAPDLYQGQVTDTVAGAERLSGALFADLERPRSDVAAAAEFLATHPGRRGRGLAVIGFSLGAFFALDLSITAPELIRSVVVFYGTRPGDYVKSSAAYLGHFAETDAFEPRSEVEKLEASLRRAGRPVDFYQYDGTGHWFFEADRVEAYDEAAASLAWDRTLAFLEQPKVR